MYWLMSLKEAGLENSSNEESSSSSQTSPHLFPGYLLGWLYSRVLRLSATDTSAWIFMWEVT